MTFIILSARNRVKKATALQVKKSEVRVAILDSAYALFRDRGYAGTTQAQIARRAGVAASSLYVYFDSKLDILFAVYRPWLMKRFDELESRVADIAAPRDRLETILYAIWRDIPREDNGFVNNLMQAISNLGPDDNYSRDLLDDCESRISGMIAGCLPADRAVLVDERNILAHILFMAQDGFAISYKISGESSRMDAMVAAMTDMLTG
jgi:AcrR family transcriptional regulator